MSFGKLINKIRSERSESLKDFGEKLGVSHAFIDQIEKGISKPSKKFLEKTMQAFPLQKSKLLTEYFKEEMPDAVLDEIKGEMRSEFKDELVTIKATKIPVYGLASAGSGAFEVDNVEMLEVLLPESLKDRKNLYGLKVNGDSMEPKFENGDVLILDDCIPSIEELHNKEVVVLLNDKKYLKKLKF